MRFSKFLLKTQKEQPSDVDSTAMSYMVRAGMVKKVSAGLFHYMPYFNMILRKVSYQIRRAMENVDCNEMKFPILVSKEISTEKMLFTVSNNEIQLLENVYFMQGEEKFRFAWKILTNTYIR